MYREQDKYYYYVHFTNDDIADIAQAHTARKWCFLDFFLALLFHCRDLIHNNVIKLNFDQQLEVDSLKTTY